MRIFLKNSDGKPSVSLTMVVISFNVVILWLVAWIFGSALGVAVPEFDVASATGLLMPILGLYFGRRWNSSPSSSTYNNEDKP